MHGNLEELKEHVRRGHSVQVGVRQLFGFAEDAMDGPSHISFVTTMQPVIRDGHVQSNCDLVVIGAPKWPCTWRDGLHVAMMLPSISGEVLCFLAELGNLPFKRVIRRHAMQWLVAETA